MWVGIRNSMVIPSFLIKTGNFDDLVTKRVAIIILYDKECYLGGPKVHFLNTYLKLSNKLS